jgi:acyl phosphate:glycerol-3-phosphate acyltransferase
MESIISLLIAYLLGSIPTGLLLTRALKGIDIREHGSKNIGATNVFRVVGKKWGIVVLIIDAFKGWLAVTLPFRLFPGELPEVFGIALAAATLAGNTFPVWLKFKGGKGIATSLGVFLGLLPVPALVTFGLWSAVFAITRILSVASLAAAFFFPAAIYFFQPKNESFPYFLIMSLFLPVFICYTHRANIQRLLKGEEKRLI